MKDNLIKRFKRFFKRKSNKRIILTSKYKSKIPEEKLRKAVKYAVRKLYEE